MPRTKALNDDHILNAAIQLVGQQGIEALTFAKLSKQVGLAPATLVQRFGTKHNLLSSAAGLCFSEMSNALDTARRQYASPLRALEEGIASMAGSVRSPATYANGLTIFSISLSDAEAYRQLEASSQRLHEDLCAMLESGIRASELKPMDTDKVAYALHALYEGAITTWAMHQKGTAADWVREQFIVFIQPYLVNKPDKEPQDA